MGWAAWAISLPPGPHLTLFAMTGKICRRVVDHRRRPARHAGRPLAALAHALDPRLPPDTPAEQAARAALDHLATRQTPFLLIYDDAPNPRALAGLLPPRGARALITFRHFDRAAQARELRVSLLRCVHARLLLPHV